MNAITNNSTKQSPRTIRTILPVILRITLSVALWTLGAIIVPPAEAQSGEHKAVQELPVDRARVENLQRWVNAGHDSWCRDAKFVAMMTLRGASPEFSRDEYTLTSLSDSTERVSPTQAVYTMHSLDGHTTYRVTLRRYRWQKKSAGSIENAIWIPIRTEIITHDTLD